MRPYLSEKLVLSFLSVRLKATVPEIASHLSIPKPTILGIMNRLKDKGFVTAGESVASGRGRPVLTYNLNLPSCVCGFFFNGTHLAGAVFDRDLAVKACETIEFTKIETLDEAVKLISQQYNLLLKKAHLAKSEAPAVSILINAISIGQRVLSSSVLPWVGDELKQKLSEELGVNVKFANIPNMLASYQKLPSPVPASVTMFRVGDGISSHMILENNFFKGASSRSGELGHQTIDPDGPLCGCGRKGCLEAYCSGPAIYNRVIQDLQTGVKSFLNSDQLEGTPPRQAIELIWQSWQDGDTYIQSCMDEVFDKLSWGLGMLMNLIDPEMVIFGGYVLQNKKEWIEVIKHRSNRWILDNSQRKTVYQLSSATLEEELRAIGTAFYYQE